LTIRPGIGATIVLGCVSAPACYGSDLERRWKKARNFHRYAVVYGPAAA